MHDVIHNRDNVLADEEVGPVLKKAEVRDIEYEVNIKLAFYACRSQNHKQLADFQWDPDNLQQWNNQGNHFDDPHAVVPICLVVLNEHCIDRVELPDEDDKQNYCNNQGADVRPSYKGAVIWEFNKEHLEMTNLNVQVA